MQQKPMRISEKKRLIAQEKGVQERVQRAIDGELEGFTQAMQKANAQASEMIVERVNQGFAVVTHRVDRLEKSFEIVKGLYQSKSKQGQTNPGAAASASSTSRPLPVSSSASALAGKRSRSPSPSASQPGDVNDISKRTKISAGSNSV